MVHALQEIVRVLVPRGLLIDLRPLLGRWPVEVAWGNEYREVGRLTDLPEGLSDDEAANQVMEEAANRNWLRWSRATIFFILFLGYGQRDGAVCPQRMGRLRQIG
jgi:hypothetical protein